MDDSDLERRIRDRAYQIWLDEGRPHGRHREHWDLAKLAIAEQDGLQTTLVPPMTPDPEPIEAVKNQGEFPTLVDQGEGSHPPKRRGDDWRPRERLNGYGFHRRRASR